MEKINDVYLAVGSNLGDRVQHIQDAVSQLNSQGKVLAISPLYENKAVGFEAEQLFLNACIHLQTDLNPEALLKHLKAIENQLGRTFPKEPGYSSRPIDLDIVFFNEEIHQTAELIIPHLKYSERNFVLKPLSDLCASKRCPLRQLTVSQLLEWSVDKNPVFVYNSGQSIVIKC